MTIVNFIVRGQLVDEQTVASCFTGESLTLGGLKEIFPFEGVFAFRQRVDPRSIDMPNSGTDFVWLDLSDKNERINTSTGIVDITALAISLPEYSDAVIGRSLVDYYQGLARDLALNGMNPHQRPMRQELSRADGEPVSQQLRSLSVNNVTKAASSIWSTVVSTASTLHSHVVSHPIAMSEASKNILNFLSSELATAFDDKQPGHLHRMQDIWECFFPGEAFQRESPQWRLLGFQKPDPALDLSKSGVLPLLNMSFFCQQNSAQAKSMITAQRENKNSNYPFAIVCINITLLLADILGLRDKKYLAEPAPYLQLLENELGFLELFAVCLLHLDYLWNSRNAVRTDFGKIMTELKKVVSTVLKRGPTSVSSLHDIAVSEGMQSMF